MKHSQINYLIGFDQKIVEVLSFLHIANDLIPVFFPRDDFFDIIVQPPRDVPSGIVHDFFEHFDKRQKRNRTELYPRIE